jgi:hypothetical protein
MQNEENNCFISKRESGKYFPQANAEMFDVRKGDNIRLRFKIHLKKTEHIGTYVTEYKVAFGLLRKEF